MENIKDNIIIDGKIKNKKDFPCFLRARTKKTLLSYIAHILIVAVFAASFINFTGCQEPIAAQPSIDTISSTLIFAGVDTTFPPFAYLDKGEAAGFDIDVISEISKRLNKQLRIEPWQWEPEFKELQDGKFDLLISAIPYEERKEAVFDFSKPYFNMSFLLISLAGSQIKTRDSILGENTGMLDSSKGCFSEEYLAEFEIVYYRNIIEMLEALKSGQIDAMLLNLPISVNLIKENRDIYTVLEEVESNRELVIALRKGSPLKDDIDSVLEEMHNDGTMDLIYEKWFTYNPS